ncbi:MAG: hypothetical protein IPG19_12050 [Burkholderiales bacterium]|nr:hypothetical protein [Burkholderiales bacterium]
MRFGLAHSGTDYSRYKTFNLSRHGADDSVRCAVLRVEGMGFSGGDWFAVSQFGSASTPSPASCAPSPSHSGGPHAGVMRGAFVSTPM